MENEKVTKTEIIELIIGILGAVCILLVLWHVFTPRDWHIEGFWGIPLFICMCISGLSFHVGLDKIR